MHFQSLIFPLKIFRSLRSKSTKYSRSQLVCLVSLDMTALFYSGRTPSSWRAPPQHAKKNQPKLVFFHMLRGPESNGRPQVMSLMRYRFSTPLYKLTLFLLSKLPCMSAHNLSYSRYCSFWRYRFSTPLCRHTLYHL